jgi:16S rRNA G966 N2-methylase RsmD
MFQGIHDYFFGQTVPLQKPVPLMVGGSKDSKSKVGFTLAEKKIIAKKLKNITEEEAVKDYEHLKQIDLKKVTNETRIGNKFVDYFTFPQRLETVSKKGMNYFDFLQDTEYHKKEYIKRLLDYQKGDDKQVALYRVFKLHCGSIGLFKPLNAMEVFHRFKPHSVLDFCMGWGGRLVGACALDVPNYIGIELNKNLKEPYLKMTKLLNQQGTKTKIKLMFKDALKVDYSKLNYDMVLTSPPYYNVEIYEGTTVRTEEEWDQEFYIPLFTKTYKHLKKGGHYALNVSQKIYENVCLDLFGPADIKMHLKKKSRPKNKLTKKDYGEYIYLWTKGP